MQQTAEQTAPSLPTASAFAQSNIAVSTLVILALMSGWAIYLYFGIGSLIPSEVPSKPPNRTDTETPNPTTEAESSVVNYEEAEEAFVLDLQRCEIQERIEATRALLENARYSVTRFRKRIDDLRTSEAGRRLATPDAAGKANFLFHFPGQVDLANVEDEMLSVEQALKITHQPLVNFGQLVEKLIAAEVEIERSSRRCADANHAIDQLLSENQATQPITLQEAIQQLRQFHSHAVQRQVDEKIAAEQARQEAQLQGETERYNKLRSELTEATHKYDLVRRQAPIEISAAQRSVQDARQELATRKTKATVAMRAAYPDVRALLTPFTTPGYKQPGSSGSLQFTSEKQPMSYAGLLRTRALVDSTKGRELLFSIAQPLNALGKLNDRPLGGFPPNRNHYDIDNAEVREKLKRAQAFLRNYGEAMVEAGLLSP